MIKQWKQRLQAKYTVIVHGHDDEEARGGEENSPHHRWHTNCLSVGYGKNRAVEYSSGRFLCFQDAVETRQDIRSTKVWTSDFRI